MDSYKFFNNNSINEIYTKVKIGETMQVLQNELNDKNFNPVFQTSHNNTDKYKHISSEDLINYMERQGFERSSISYAIPRKQENRGFQKHIMTFTRDDLRIDDDNYITVMLTNSHDGKSSLRINIGIYRVICANGLIVGNTFEERRIKHIGQEVKSELYKHLYDIVAIAPTISNTIKKMQNTNYLQMNTNKYLALINSVKCLRFSDSSIMDVNLKDFITPIREQDKKLDLYTLFNIVQEKIIRGGVRYTKEFKRTDENNVVTFERKNLTTRAVTGIDTKTHYNKALWDLFTKEVA